MADALIPRQALGYIKNKSLRPAFSYKDVWNEEHAAAFMVAKAMQLDVLSDIKTAVEKAIESGTTFEQFKKDLKPTLMQKGWWGRREMTDPLTGETVDAQLGSDRRLRTIYQTNLRSAYQKGQYDRTMASDAHPYLMYRIGASVRHREQHLKWANLILPKDDPLWNSIFPPNGYGCQCYTVAVTQARKERYERNGVPAYNPDTHQTVRMPVQTVAPKPSYRNYFNERKGTLERIPQGITPGFNWNQGLPRDKQMEHTLKMKIEAQKAYLAESIGKEKPQPKAHDIEKTGFFKSVAEQTNKKVAERFRADFEKITETHRRLLQKYSADMEIDCNSKSEYCIGNKIFITLNKKDERSSVLGFTTDMRVFLHESGHYLDGNALGNGKTIHASLPDLRKKLRNDALQYASSVLELEKPLKSVKELQNLNWDLQCKLCKSLSDEAAWKNGISDIFDGLTHGDIHGSYIHKTSYWKGDNLECETMAHFFEARAADGRKLRLLREHFPSAYQYFDEFVRNTLEAEL